MGQQVCGGLKLQSSSKHDRSDLMQGQCFTPVERPKAPLWSTEKDWENAGDVGGLAFAGPASAKTRVSELASFPEPSAELKVLGMPGLHCEKRACFCPTPRADDFMFGLCPFSPRSCAH